MWTYTTAGPLADEGGSDAVGRVDRPGLHRRGAGGVRGPHRDRDRRRSCSRGRRSRSLARSGCRGGCTGTGAVAAPPGSCSSISAWSPAPSMNDNPDASTIAASSSGEIDSSICCRTEVTLDMSTSLSGTRRRSRRHARPGRRPSPRQAAVLRRSSTTVPVADVSMITSSISARISFSPFPRSPFDAPRHVPESRIRASMC